MAYQVGSEFSSPEPGDLRTAFASLVVSVVAVMVMVLVRESLPAIGSALQVISDTVGQFATKLLLTVALCLAAIGAFLLKRNRPRYYGATELGFGVWSAWAALGPDVVNLPKLNVRWDYAVAAVYLIVRAFVNIFGDGHGRKGEEPTASGQLRNEAERTRLEAPPLSQGAQRKTR